MEVRSSRRMRTLVTQMAGRGLSANKIACALISMMARSAKRSNQRPDTLMQDRSPPARQRLLQRTAGPYIRVIHDGWILRQCCPMSVVTPSATILDISRLAAIDRKRSYFLPRPHAECGQRRHVCYFSCRLACDMIAKTRAGKRLTQGGMKNG